MSWIAIILYASLLSGCTSMAAVTNLETNECRNAVVSQIAAILAEQGETMENAARLGESTARSLATGSYGPRPFLVASPSGADYAFFIQRKKSYCLLRLYARRGHHAQYPAFKLRMRTEVTGLIEKHEAVVGLHARGPDGLLVVRASCSRSKGCRHSGTRCGSWPPLWRSGWGSCRDGMPSNC